MRYLGRKIAGGILTLMAMTFLVFCLQSVVPADPAASSRGRRHHPPRSRPCARRWAWDENVITRYDTFLPGSHMVTSASLGPHNAASGQRYSEAPARVDRTCGCRSAARHFGGRHGGGRPGHLSIVAHAASRTRRARVLASVLTGLMLVLVVWYKLGWLPGSGRLGVRGFSGPTGLLLVDTLISGKPAPFRGRGRSSCPARFGSRATRRGRGRAGSCQARCMTS